MRRRRCGGQAGALRPQLLPRGRRALSGSPRPADRGVAYNREQSPDRWHCRSGVALEDRHDVVEGSFQHILTDLYAFIGTAITAVVILITGFERADPIASLFVAALMLRSAYGLLKGSGRVFLEAAPEGLEPDKIGQAQLTEPGVVEVHDLHVWEVTSGFSGALGPP